MEDVGSTTWSTTSYGAQLGCEMAFSASAVSRSGSAEGSPRAILHRPRSTIPVIRGICRGWQIAWHRGKRRIIVEGLGKGPRSSAQSATSRSTTSRVSRGDRALSRQRLTSRPLPRWDQNQVAAPRQRQSSHGSPGLRSVVAEHRHEGRRRVLTEAERRSNFCIFLP